jgi:ABC-type transport system substrate-binding protein
MKPLCLRLVATSCCLVMAAGSHASSRPRYGGMVRILLHDRVNTIDPAAEDDHPAARDRLAGLLFETLAVFDDQGRLQPGLATSWSPDNGKRTWQFHLRLAKFSDGSQLIAGDVVAGLTRAGLPWKCTASDRQTVMIEASGPVPHMPELLALAKFAVVKRQPDGTLLGTGPYKMSEWRPGERALLIANEDHWEGRAFPDAIEVQMGGSLRERLLERQLGPYAAADLTLDQLRSLDGANQDILVSHPADLLVILFLQPDSAPPGKAGRKAVDARVREAMANALDRATISNALLQRKSSAASGVLPQWLTGYEFLFPSLSDRARARKLAADAGLAGLSPLALAYDFSDPVAKLVAERIVVDCGQVGITVRAYGDAHVNTRSGQASLTADAVMLRLPLRSLEPSVALLAINVDLGLDAEYGSALLSAGRPEDLYEIERKMLENFRVVPVAHVSQALWLNGNAHNWQQLPTGAWNLNQLWMEGARPSVP